MTTVAERTPIIPTCGLSGINDKKRDFMLRKMLAVISPRFRNPSACECCGNDFVCGASVRGCWCMEIALEARVREGLRDRYHRCICRDCLVRFGSGSGNESDGLADS